LVADGTKKVGAMSREWLLDQSYPGLCVSYGGKLTSARVEADKTVTAVLTMLGKPPQPCPTADRPLPWAPTEPWSLWCDRHIMRGQQLGLDRETAATAVCRYGTTIEQLWRHLAATPSDAERIDPRYAFCRAEITIAQQHEMAVTHEDIFRRRIPLAILAADMSHQLKM
jgi:glycerol-3-phosphate dehydrogenase